MMTHVWMRDLHFKPWSNAQIFGLFQPNLSDSANYKPLGRPVVVADDCWYRWFRSGRSVKGEHFAKLLSCSPHPTVNGILWRLHMESRVWFRV